VIADDRGAPVAYNELVSHTPRDDPAVHRVVFQVSSEQIAAGADASVLYSQKFDRVNVAKLHQLAEAAFQYYQCWRLRQATSMLVAVGSMAMQEGSIICFTLMDPLASVPADPTEAIKLGVAQPGHVHSTGRMPFTVKWPFDNPVAAGTRFTNIAHPAALTSYGTAVIATRGVVSSGNVIKLTHTCDYELEFSHPIIPAALASYSQRVNVSAGTAISHDDGLFFIKAEIADLEDAASGKLLYDSPKQLLVRSTEASDETENNPNGDTGITELIPCYFQQTGFKVNTDGDVWISVGVPPARVVLTDINTSVLEIMNPDALEGAASITTPVASRRYDPSIFFSTLPPQHRMRGERAAVAKSMYVGTKRRLAEKRQVNYFGSENLDFLIDAVLSNTRFLNIIQQYGPSWPKRVLPHSATDRDFGITTVAEDSGAGASREYNMASHPGLQGKESHSRETHVKGGRK